MRTNGHIKLHHGLDQPFQHFKPVDGLYPCTDLNFRISLHVVQVNAVHVVEVNVVHLGPVNGLFMLVSVVHTVPGCFGM